MRLSKVDLLDADSIAYRPSLPPKPKVELISMPLAAITALFPEEMRPILRKQPSEHIHIDLPREPIREQLATGAVRIPFSELCAATPEIFFHPEAVDPDALVHLPLGPILAQMMPPLRKDQYRPDFAADIPNVFKRNEKTKPCTSASTCDPTPAATASATSPASPESFAIPFSVIKSSIPPEVLRAFESTDPASACFKIPLDELESRLRTGRVRFQWGELRGSCSAEPAQPLPVDLDIEFPLAAIVPLYLSARKPPAHRPGIELDSRIPPTVFKKTRVAQQASPTHPGLVAPRHSAGITGPAQVVERLRAMLGVTGAFIATADGLLVASDVPDSNETALAAFAPATFSQVTNFAGMAHLAQPQNLDVRLGNGTTIHICRAGSLYIGVLLAPGAAAPLPAISTLAKTLQPHTT